VTASRKKWPNSMDLSGIGATYAQYKGFWRTTGGLILVRFFRYQNPINLFRSIIDET